MSTHNISFHGANKKSMFFSVEKSTENMWVLIRGYSLEYPITYVFKQI